MSFTSRQRGDRTNGGRPGQPRGETVMGHARTGGQASDEASGAAPGPTPAVANRHLQIRTRPPTGARSTCFRDKSATVDAHPLRAAPDDSTTQSHSVVCDRRRWRDGYGGVLRCPSPGRSWSRGLRAVDDDRVVVVLLVARVRSARRIERACLEDVACRVLAAHGRPDHATIARFVVRHERALGELFGEVLVLCADAGLATVGGIAIDGTKGGANA